MRNALVRFGRAGGGMRNALVRWAIPTIRSHWVSSMSGSSDLESDPPRLTVSMRQVRKISATALHSHSVSDALDISCRTRRLLMMRGIKRIEMSTPLFCSSLCPPPKQVITSRAWIRPCKMGSVGDMNPSAVCIPSGCCQPLALVIGMYLVERPCWLEESLEVWPSKQLEATGRILRFMKCSNLHDNNDRSRRVVWQPGVC